MARCEVCGNEYDKPIQVFDGTTHTFDCFECAIHASRRSARTVDAA